MLKKILPLLFFLLITGVFFYKIILHGFVPFPGDLLVSEYNPWKTYSYLGYNPGSYPNKAQYFDVLRQLYPWKTLVVNQIKEGHFPLWNPYNFSGTPLFANFQSSALYPLSIVYYILPQIYAWSLLIVIQPFLASLLTYLYCRKIKISKISSLFAGVTFGFSSFMSVWLEYNTIGHVILWLPLILLSVENLREKIYLRWGALLIFGLVSSIFGGHPQLFAYVFIFSLLYSLVRVERKRIKYIALLLLLSLGIGAIQIVPGYELISNSARSSLAPDFFYNKILIQWWQLIMVFVPDFFGNPATRNYWVSDTFVGDVIYFGIVPLLFIPFAVASFRKNYYVRLYVWSSFLLLLLLTLNPVSFLFYKLPIPFISGSGANFLVFLLIFSCSILAGIGMDRLKEEKIRLLYYVLFGLIPVTLLILIELMMKIHSFFWSANLPTSIKPIVYSSVILYLSLLVMFLGKMKKNLTIYMLLFLLVIQIADLFRFFDKFNPFVPVELVFPPAKIAQQLKNVSGVNRYFSYENAYVEANFDTQLNLYSPNGYDPLYPKSYGEFIHLSLDGTLANAFGITTRSDAVVSQDVNRNSLKVLNLLGVAYILNRPALTWKISSNKDAFPRAFMGSDYKLYKSQSEFEKLFASVDLKKTILLSEKPTLNFKQAKDPKVSFVSYSPDQIVLNTTSKQNQLLFISDSYYPGWKAYVDGLETRIYKADYAFRTIAVPRGNHKVIFVYDPKSFEIGKWITLISFITFAVFALFLRYNKNR